MCANCSSLLIGLVSLLRELIRSVSKIAKFNPNRHFRKVAFPPKFYQTFDLQSAAFYFAEIIHSVPDANQNYKSIVSNSNQATSPSP